MSKKRLRREISVFKVAATYIGTVVGAGFASGQEILQFFAVFGSDGFLGLVIVTILFIFYGYIIMKLGNDLNSSSHVDVIKKAGGKYIGPVLDLLITFFLFGSLTAMIAGSGAIFRQQFNLPEVWGNLLMIVITTVTVLTGIEGVINSISFVVPFLLVVALGVSIYSMFFIPFNLNQKYYSFNNSLIINWFWAAILYASYNIIISVSVLAPLGSNAKDNKKIKKGSILGGFFLGLGAFAIYIALRRSLDEIIFMEIPMAYIAGKISHMIQIIYVIVLLAEIYTTAVGSLFGFAARISNSNYSLRLRHFISPNNKLVIIFTAILAFLVSRYGFSNLVSRMYPLMGYGGCILLTSLLYSFIKEKLHK